MSKCRLRLHNQSPFSSSNRQRLRPVLRARHASSIDVRNALSRLITRHVFSLATACGRHTRRDTSRQAAEIRQQIHIDHSYKRRGIRCRRSVRRGGSGVEMYQDQGTDGLRYAGYDNMEISQSSRSHLGLTGILNDLSTPLKAASISIFALSTWYVRSSRILRGFG